MEIGMESNLQAFAACNLAGVVVVYFFLYESVDNLIIDF